MRVLLWIIRLLIFIFLLGFAAMNSDPVSLRFFFDTQWQAPLVIILLGFFAAGTLLGILALLGTLFHLRRDLSRARRDLEHERSLKPAAKPGPVTGTNPPPAGEAVAQ
ncbi:hypothetical protein AZSI13_20490 [Azospira sp. I13]|uniref:LapA family protein n=1 Tax=Azospira sp. I13 TaxID=1765050 RepID=UPI000D4DA33A|nr:LapA family protein [Azospira sp. I13]GBG02722.1 hypothetical protein AZSI13_20490 [Azospira sp. I13]